MHLNLQRKIGVDGILIYSVTFNDLTKYIYITSGSALTHKQYTVNMCIKGIVFWCDIEHNIDFPFRV